MKQSFDIILKQEIFKLLSKVFKKDLIKIQEIGFPPNNKFGDLSFGCFEISKKMSLPPNKVAEDFVQKIKNNYNEKIFSKIVNVGPYVNFFIQKDFLIENILINYPLLQEVASLNKTLMLEYSGPNPCKSFHIGHFRNTILGSCLINLFKLQGYKVIPVNYLNDTGIHTAKVIWIYLKEFKGKEPEQKKGEWLGDLYIRANQILKQKPELLEQVYEIHRSLEEKQKEFVELLEKFKQWSLDDFNEIYKQLDADFEIYFYDSDYIESGKAFVQELLEKGIAKQSQGAVIVDLQEYGLETVVILKSDGSCLYITKDLAMAQERFQKYKIDKLVYVVGAEQKLHFKQLFKILELYGFEQAKDCVHFSYELVNSPEGKKLSTRTGEVFLYKDIYKNAFDLAFKETKLRHNNWDDEKIKHTAEIIALSALKFDMLKQDANKVINFDIQKALDISGDTGPYILYTIARIYSILEKQDSDEFGNISDFSSLDSQEELDLINKILRFNEAVQFSAENLKPSHLAHFAIELAHSFNNFYHKHRILGLQDKNLQALRLLLVKKVVDVLEEIFKILNIRTLKQM